MAHPRTRRGRSRLPARALALGTAVAMLVAGCGDDGEDPTATDGADPSPTATAAPTPSPTAGPSPDGSPTGPDDGTTPDRSNLGTLAYIDRTFGQDDEDTSRLVVREVPDGEERVVAEHAIMTARWDPTGERIAYVVHPPQAEGPAEQLHVVRVGEDATSVLVEGNLNGIDWSPDGQRLAVSMSEFMAEGGARIHVVDVATGELTSVSEPPQNADDFEPAWSPDGQRIAFRRIVHTERAEERPDDVQVLSVGPNGEDVREHAGSLLAESGPAWSADGRRLAMTASEQPGFEAPRGVYLATLNDGTVERLAVEGARARVVFDPSGQRLAVSVGSRPDVGDIAIVEVADGSRVATFDAGAFDIRPTWTPDGGAVAFVAASGLEGSADLALGTVEDGSVRMLTDDGSVESPDFPTS